MELSVTVVEAAFVAIIIPTNTCLRVGWVESAGWAVLYVGTAEGSCSDDMVEKRPRHCSGQVVSR